MPCWLVLPDRFCERPLARLREFEGSCGRARGGSRPEVRSYFIADHGRPCRRPFAAEDGVARQLFKAHLASWIGRFFGDLELRRAADFYRHVGTLGKVFVNIEMEAFVPSGAFARVKE
jgi:hypothetical protein